MIVFASGADEREIANIVGVTETTISFFGLSEAFVHTKRIPKNTIGIAIDKMILLILLRSILLSPISENELQQPLYVMPPTAIYYAQIYKKGSS